MRNHNPKVHYMRIAESVAPEMRYDGKEDFFLWQKKAKEKLKELLGLPLIEKCEPDFLIEDEKEFEEYKEIRFSFQSEEGYYPICVIRIPHGIKDKIVQWKTTKPRNSAAIRR